MPNPPYIPRPVPQESQAPARTVAPATTKSVIATEVAPMSTGPLEGKPPPLRREPAPAKRGRKQVRFPDGEPHINMQKWHVDPNRIAHEIGFPRVP